MHDSQKDAFDSLAVVDLMRVLYPPPGSLTRDEILYRDANIGRDYEEKRGKEMACHQIIQNAPAVMEWLDKLIDAQKAMGKV